MPSPRPTFFLLPLALLGTLACSRDEVRRSREVPAPAAPSAPMTMPMGAPGGMTGDVPPPPSPSAVLKWTLPKGWTEERTGGMRFATFKPPVSGNLEAFVVVLPGTAGGELANVNRWRGQIGLPPIDESALASARKALKSKAGSIALFDFTNEDTVKTRLITGVATTPDGNSWFLKIKGNADAVAKVKPDFIHLLESLRLDSKN